MLCECALGRHPFLTESEFLPRDYGRMIERVKKGQAFTQAIPKEHGNDLVHLVSAFSRISRCCHVQAPVSSFGSLVVMGASKYYGGP